MKETRVAYLNGRILSESEVNVSFRDRGFVLGDAVFDAARTFNGQIFRLVEHVDRLYQSLEAVQIDPGISSEEMIRISESVVEQNLPLLSEGEDYWVIQRVTRGERVVGGELRDSTDPTVIVECDPLPFRARAHLFREGIDVLTPTSRRVPPECLNPNVKSHNYLNLVLADLEVRNQADNPWAVLLDTRGFLSEGIGSNLFLVRDGQLLTPKAQYVLEGVSRQVVIELAASLEISVFETDLSTEDAESADEAFITSTSFCLCPVRTYNGKQIGNGSVPGPITQSLTDAFCKLVNCDFVSQYVRTLDDV
jgi:branched-chain amino acid aminotransferase